MFKKAGHPGRARARFATTWRKPETLAEETGYPAGRQAGYRGGRQPRPTRFTITAELEAFFHCPPAGRLYL